MAVTAGTLAPIPVTPPVKVAGPGALNVKFAFTPRAVALTVTGPVAGPMVTRALAVPAAPVSICAGADTLAEPATTVKLTSAPANAFPEVSVTCTTRGAGTG
jgi:hypothetical protein